MAALRDESTLYKKLDDMYMERGEKDISEKFFDECVSVAAEFSKREIRFALYKLKVMEENIDTGMDRIDLLLNSLQKVLNVIMGKNVKKAFMIAVLESALEEKP